MKSLIKKNLLQKKEERRTKQSLDSPQTIEANKKILIVHEFFVFIFSYFLDDKCQYWLNENAGVLRSPFFNGVYPSYYNNLNCTWMFKAKDGFYVNIEIFERQFTV